MRASHQREGAEAAIDADVPSAYSDCRPEPCVTGSDLSIKPRAGRGL